MAVSNWYYLLPILLGLIGGIIMYFVVKDKNKKMAKNGLMLGLALFALSLIIGYAMGSLSPSSAISPASIILR